MMCYTHLLLLVALVGAVGASVIERPRVRSYSPFAKNVPPEGRATHVTEVKTQAQNQSPVVVPSWPAVDARKKNYSPFKSVQAQSLIAPVPVPVVASVAVASNVWSAVAEPVVPKKNYSPFKSVKAQIQSQTAFVAVPVVAASVAVASSSWSTVAEFAAPTKKSYSPFKSVQAQAQARPTAYVPPDLMSSLRAAPATVTPASPATPPPSSIFSLLARRVSGIVRMLKLDRLRVIAASVVAAFFFGKKKTSLAA